MGTLESGGGWGTLVAYAAIIAFVVVLALVLARTVALTGVLWLAPLGRVWRWLRARGRHGGSP